ncbi:DUF2723 domain-containing protein [Bacteroidota bacterium]
MNQYKTINTITGWIIFLIASFIYLSTIEPTASLWDCGEFIASGYKFEVGHPPGAPFFMLLVRFFTLFAGDNIELVPKLANALSALASSFTILFLFWTITHLSKKIINKDQEPDLYQTILIIGSGIVGALAYTFSDTFWFSAVEGEVYATSSLITAIVFWIILKWENEIDPKYENRWIILTSYIIGISIGVHLLNLLAIPAIVFVFYYKKFTPSRNGFIAATVISIVIIGFIMYGFIPGIVKIASWFELAFVNGFGLPYNSGVLFYIVILIVVIAWGLNYTHKKRKLILNTLLLSFAVMLIGYSSYTIIIVRSNADPPMDQNNPDNLFSLLYYLNREQYGDRPLFKGQYYNAPVVGRKDGSPVYAKEGGKYVVIDKKTSYEYDKRFTTFFPRMFSSESEHIKIYEKWGKVKGRPVRLNYRGQNEVRRVPSFGENLRFFFTYQVGYMYFRYFLWNFAGRQNDQQGVDGELLKGNWISGIPFIDDSRLGPQDMLPDELAGNKGRNRYYMLPLLLGLIGTVFHYMKHKRDFLVVTLLFVLTGLAIVVYLNQNPIQPRERDYAYAGSFYAFTIWIGIGVLAITERLKKLMPLLPASVVSILLTLVLVPGIMAKENKDDHDRSNRYTTIDFASNYLETCAPNAILFTNGDNDTFPLWYAQEVEGIRTDVRVINLSYLTADWYIEQFRRQAYESEPVPFGLGIDQIKRGNRDVLPIIERIKEPVDLVQVMEMVRSEDKRAKVQSPFQKGVTNYIPTRRLFLEIDKERILNTGTVRKKDRDLIVDRMTWSLPGSYILKNRLMILDLLSANNWERPVYYAITVAGSNYMNLQSYFQLEGLAFRIVPIRATGMDGTGRVNTDIMYENLINKFKWGGLEEGKEMYLNEDVTRMLYNYRNNFARLAEALINEGRIDSAKVVIKRCLEIIPHDKVAYNYYMIPITEILYKLDEIETANQIALSLTENANQHLEFFFSLEDDKLKSLNYEVNLHMHILQEMLKFTSRFKQDDVNKEIEQLFNEYAQAYSQKFQS